MTLDINSFDFEALKAVTKEDPFAEKKYKTDDRFYKLQRNENDQGVAFIIFLPDSEKRIIHEFSKINFQGENRRFVSEFSPTNIGLPDPFHEKWQALRNEGKKYESRRYARHLRYITNIKVILDPLHPENNGKNFLFEMSKTMADKIKDVMCPSEQDLAMGAEKKEVFNPLRGVVYKLVASKGSNGFINYDKSVWTTIQEIQPILQKNGITTGSQTSYYSDVNALVDDINKNTYKISDLLDPKNYLTYDELVKKMNWALGQAETETVKVAEVNKGDTEVQAVESSQTTQTQTQQTPQQVQEAQNIDDLLSGLV